jgi:Protein of unknown function (DUF1565)
MLGGYIGQFQTAANVTGTVAIAHGGTGATTAAASLTNLGALATAGGTMTGALSMGGQSITHAKFIQDNQSTPVTRINCGGAAGTAATSINDSTGATQISVTSGVVTIPNTLATTSLSVSGTVSLAGAIVQNSLTVTGNSGSNGNISFYGSCTWSQFSANTIIFVDPINGDDANNGQYLTPLETIAHAVSIASSGMQIFLMPGTFNEGGSTQIVLPAGVHLKGAGIDVTNIVPTNTSGAYDAPFIVLGNGSVVSDLTINTSGNSGGPACIGANDGSFGLNPSLYRVKCIGVGKALDYEASATSGTSYLYCEECIFQGSFRCAVVSMSPGTLKTDFHRCQFLFTYNASVGDSFLGECLFVECTGGARLFGCVLSMTDTVHSSWSGLNYQMIDCDQPLELYGTHLITNFPSLPAAPPTVTPGTNPGFWALSNTAVTKIGGGCTISPQVSDVNTNLYQTLPSLASHSYPLSVTLSGSTANLWGESSNALFEIAVDAATLSSDTLTIANITATTVPLADGQKMRLRIKNTNSSSTAMTLAFGTTFNNGAFSISTIAAGKRAYLDFIYDADNSKWDLTGYVSGI